MQEGKGRCDLLPLDVCADLLDYYCGNYEELEKSTDPLLALSRFVSTHQIKELYYALHGFCCHNSWDLPQMLLEVSKHFEEGATKYGVDNWKLGIPAHCYIDSAVRHYLKWYMDLVDERHDRAFCWNILCLAWTLEHRPECNDLLEDNNG